MNDDADEAGGYHHDNRACFELPEDEEGDARDGHGNKIRVFNAVFPESERHYRNSRGSNQGDNHGAQGREHSLELV